MSVPHIKFNMMRRNFKKLQLLCVFLICTLSTHAQKEFDWSKLIDAIIQVESKGDKNAKNSSGNCVGILQITPILVKQCNIWLKKEKSPKRYTLNDRLNVEKSKEMFVLYQKYYNPTNNIDKAIRIWNRGPHYTIANTNAYVKKVMKYYK